MSFIANLPISRKLIAAFSAVIAVSAVSSFIVYQKLDFIQQSAGWTTHTYVVLETLDSLLASMVDQETGVRGYLVSGDEKFLEPYYKGGAAYTSAFSKIKELTSDNPAQQTRLDVLNQFAQTWGRDIAGKEIALMARPDTREQARALESSGAGKASMDALRGKVAEIGDAERALLSTRAVAQADAFAASFETTIVGGALCLLIAVSMGVVLTRGIATPITEMQEVMAKLAKGDLSVTIPGVGRKDEVGGMAETVQVFKNNLAETEHLRAEQEAQKRKSEQERRKAMLDLATKFERDVGSIVESVASAATELQSTAQLLASSSDQTRGQSMAVTSASEQVTQNVQTVASATEEMSSSVQEISQQIMRTSAMIGTGVEQANRSNERVQELSEAAEKIGTVVKIISDIASQTNLLALNATIEAARAGDAGKGFAVVASEVKALANQTAKATEEISLQIKAIQESTQVSAQSIEMVTQTIGRVNETAAAIASAVEEQGAATQEIARNVGQAAQATLEVSGNIVGVNESVQQTGSAASQVLAASSELSTNSEVLRSQLRTFLQEVRAA